VRYTWDATLEATLTTALGIDNLRYYGEVEHGGVNCCAAIGQAAAAITAGLASCVVVYRSLNARSGVRYGRAERFLAVEGDAAIVSSRTLPGDVLTAPFGLMVPPQFHALYARRYFHECGLTDDAGAAMLGAVAVTQRDYANRNPRALMRDRTLTLDAYLASPMISSPLRLYDLCLETDGAMALVLVSASRARSAGRPGVEVLAASQHLHPGSGPMLLYAEDLCRPAPPVVAAELFGRAGITARDVDVAGIYDATSILVPLALEDFGFVGRGEAHDFFVSGQNRIGGALPINTHGGLLSEGYFHGLNTIAESVRQLRGSASNQVADASVAFVTVRGASSLVLGRN
jgi:acetyl-CoA acetyltransferase